LDKNIKIKIEREIARIEKLLTDATPLLNLCKMKEPDFVEITATAQILHSFYNGVESIIILFFKNSSEKLPNDIHWHKTLFEMAFGNNSENIKIINDDVKERLGEYLSYRHFIRHSYSSELKWNEMAHLVKGLDELWERIKINFETSLNN